MYFDSFSRYKTICYIGINLALAHQCHLTIVVKRTSEKGVNNRSILIYDSVLKIQQQSSTTPNTNQIEYRQLHAQQCKVN